MTRSPDDQMTRCVTAVVCKWVQLRWGARDYLLSMMCCAYCARQATTRIVTDPQQVCLDHAVEFWTGLLNYVRDRSDPCVKAYRLCSCRRCDARCQSALRAAAIAAAGPSPASHEGFGIRPASQQGGRQETSGRERGLEHRANLSHRLPEHLANGAAGQPLDVLLEGQQQQ